MDYAWAQNRLKLERVKGELGPEASEEALKARYIEIAGRVIEADGTIPASAPVEKAPPSTDEFVAEGAELISEPGKKKTKKK